MGQITLENIPTELVLSIFDALMPKDILNVAKVCRRLNLIAIPSFLAKMGSPKPEKACLVKATSRRYIDEIAALSIHFSLTSIDQLICIVSHRYDLEETYIPPSHIRWLTNNLIRINHMLSRLTSIGSFSLVIDSWGSGWSLKSDVVQTFITSVVELTESAILKSCKSLQLLHYHPTSAERVYKFKLVGKDRNRNPVKTSLHSLTRLLSHHRRPSQPLLMGKGWKYECQQPSSTSFQLWKPEYSRSQLTHIHLDSEFLLIPPCSSWTFDVLKCSPIVSLSICLPSIITKEEFEFYLFPQLAKSLPNLREMKFAFPDDFLLKTVIEQLHCMPCLEKFTLALSFMAELPLPPPALSKPTTLYHLASFTGSPDQAAYFFSRGHSPNGAPLLCPNLKNVNLINDTFYQDHNYQTDYSSIAENICSINKRMLEMNVAPSINLCLTNHGELPEDISNSKSNNVLHWTQHFWTVSRLTFYLYPPTLHEEHDSETLHHALLSRALAWLDLFRGVRYLTLIIKHGDIDEELLESQLLTAINTAYPQLLTANVVFLNIEPKTYHYHWSNACDDLERGTSDIPTTPSYDKKSRDSYVCSTF